MSVLMPFFFWFAVVLLFSQVMLALKSSKPTVHQSPILFTIHVCIATSPRPTSQYGLGQCRGSTCHKRAVQ